MKRISCVVGYGILLNVFGGLVLHSIHSEQRKHSRVNSKQDLLVRNDESGHRFEPNGNSYKDNDFEHIAELNSVNGEISEHKIERNEHDVGNQLEPDRRNFVSNLKENNLEHRVKLNNVNDERPERNVEQENFERNVNKAEAKDVNKGSNKYHTDKFRRTGDNQNLDGEDSSNDRKQDKLEETTKGYHKNKISAVNISKLERNPKKNDTKLSDNRVHQKVM